MALGACSPSHVQRTAQVRVLADSARYSEARKELAAEAERSSLDALLVAVDQGALLHRAGDWEQSARVLNEAAALADARETVSLSQEFFGSAPWRMGTLERQTLHALNALNQLQLARPEEAAVEARLTNALHLRQHLEARHRTELERSLALVPFDEDFRARALPVVVTDAGASRTRSGLAASGDSSSSANSPQQRRVERLEGTGAQRAPQALLRRLPLRVGRLNHARPCAGQEHDTGARIVRRTRDPQPTRFFERHHVPTQRRLIQGEGLRQLANGRTAFAAGANGHQHEQLGDLDAERPHGVIVGARQQAGRLANAMPGAVALHRPRRLGAWRSRPSGA
nr:MULTISPECIES: hypothetical protein [Corallococcus]